MNELERRVLDIAYRQKLAHIGSALSALPIIKEIYETKNPDEKFILSSGHAHLSHAVVMEAKGIIKDAEKNIKTYGIHCDRAGGCDVSTGSLGHGIGIACGMALADRSKRVFCLISDGECMEGSVWEALRIAEEQKLDNLCLYFNFNGFGGYKRLNLYSLYAKINAYQINKKIYFTSIPQLPGLHAHYIVLDQKKYEELLRN